MYVADMQECKIFYYIIICHERFNGIRPKHVNKRYCLQRTVMPRGKRYRSQSKGVVMSVFDYFEKLEKKKNVSQL